MVKKTISRYCPFKAMAPSRTVIAHYALNWQLLSKAHTALTAPLVLHHTRIYKCAIRKIITNGQMQNKPFLIVIYAARVCKLCNGVNKTPQFLLFLMVKGGTKTIAHLSIAEALKLR